MYSHGIHIVFVVLLAKCLKQLTNARTPYALVHMMAAHTASHYELVSWGSGCTYLVHLPCSLSFFSSWLFFVLNQWDLDRHWSCFLLATLDRHSSCFLLATLDRHWWTFYTLKWTSSEATSSPDVRTTHSNDDYSLFSRNEMALHLPQLYCCHREPCQN